MSAVIKVEGVGKKYCLGQNNGYDSFREGLTRFFKTSPKSQMKDFWALKDLNFEISHGDKVGIIGRNGAGKSTLLKILSRITEPTVGKIKIKGRIASLLEVGTGFHPELSGRENIFLNGAILGMTRVEIKKRFEEIVSFAEVEKFLDTPVKRYSSGMYVRLAFAVAAHLEPEILIVDEVLAVGDAQFQKKCLGKMQDVSKQGRTILFVSHNMNAVTNLCEKGIFLREGRIQNIGEIKSIIKTYNNVDDKLISQAEWYRLDESNSNPWFDIAYMKLIKNESTLEDSYVSRDDELFLEIEALTIELDSALTIGYAIYNENYEPIYWSLQTDSREENWPQIKKGINRLRTKIPLSILNEGKYFIEPIGGLYFRKWLFEPGKNTIQISFDLQGGLSLSPHYQVARPTLIAPILEWQNLV